MAADLEFRIGAELTEIKGALAGLQRDFQKVGQSAQAAAKEAQKAGAISPFEGMDRNLAGVAGALRDIAAAYAAFQAAGQFIRLADEVAQYQARLRLATSSVAEFNRVNAEVFAISQRTRQGLSETANIYTRLAQSSTAAPAQILALTQTISQAIALGGQSAEASRAALVQFSQGLSAGALRGEEFNSVAEQAPRLLQALQDGLGLTRAELRRYAEEGRLTADLIERALTRQAATIDAEFAKLPTTVGQAFTVLQNAALQYVGVLDQANGITAGFSSAVVTLAENIGVLAAAIGAVVAVPLAIFLGRAAGAISAFVVGLRAIAATAGAAAAATGLLARVVGFLGGPIGAILTVLGLAASAYSAYQASAEKANTGAAASTERSTQDIVASLDKQIAKIKERNKALRESSGDQPAVPDQAAQDLAAAEAKYLDLARKSAEAKTEQDRILYAELARVAGGTYAELASKVKELRQAEGETAALQQRNAARDFFKEYATDAEKLTAELEKQKKLLGDQFTPEVEKRIRERFTKKGDAEAGKRAAEATARAQLAGIQATTDLTVDEVERALDALASLYERGQQPIQAYFAEKQRLETQAINARINAAEAEVRLARTPEERIRAETELTKLQRERAAIGPANAAAEEEANRRLLDRLGEVRTRLQELGGDTVGARRAELERQFADLIRNLEAQGNTAGAKLVRKLIDTEVSREQFAKLQQQYEKVIQELERKRAEIADRVRIGSITPAQGRQEEAGARDAALTSLQPLNQEMQELAATTQDPAFLAGAQRIKDSVKAIGDEGAPAIEKVKGQLRSTLADMEAQFAQTATSAGVDALTGLFTDLVSGSKSAGDALKDFVVGFVQSMAQIAARALATYLVLQLLDAVYPGLGKSTAAAMSAGVSHGGGIVGDGGQRRSVSPLVFAGAPRYHSGGMVGLKPDERPAILQTGEEVLSRGDPRNRANGGGSGYRIVNVLDPSLVGGYLESSAGERAVLNIIGRNPGQVRQTLGS